MEESTRSNVGGAGERHLVSVCTKRRKTPVARGDDILSGVTGSEQIPQQSHAVDAMLETSARQAIRPDWRGLHVLRCSCTGSCCSGNFGCP